MPHTSAQAPRPSGLSLVRRAAQFVAPHRLAALGILCLALVLSVLGAADPLVMKYLFDALGTGSRRALPLAVAALAALEIGRAVLGAWLRVKTSDVRIAIDTRMRDRIVAKLTALPMDWHASEGVGGTMNKVNQSVAAFVNAFGEIGFNVLPTLVYLVLSVVAMVRMEWRLALVVLAFTPLPALIGAWAAREQTQRERTLLDLWTRIYSRLNEVLAGIRTVKIFATEDAERRRYIEGQEEGNAVVAKGVRTDAASEAMRGFAASLARLAAIAFGGWLIFHGQITVGALVAFLGYVGGLFGPVQGLTNVYQTIQKATVAVETIYEILDADEIVADAPDAQDAGALRGDIRFHNVTFAHADGTPVFTDLNLTVRPGETVALVGPSGSGKSTLMNLLLRLHPLESGSISIDGRDIRALTAGSLRRQVSFVAQDVHLFNDTVRANIAYGRPDASETEIVAAAMAAHAHEFILALPDGYDTPVGERGSRLSGGQRQRVAIARAILKDSPILVLDEATSALDTVSEAIVQDSLSWLSRDRTTVVIAHRLSTVVEADRIVVIKDGGILADGPHEQLLRENEYYASLVGASTNGLLAQVA